MKLKFKSTLEGQTNSITISMVFDNTDMASIIAIGSDTNIYPGTFGILNGTESEWYIYCSSGVFRQ
ncbi:hypothetical protein FACS1894172_06530 [Spirochaetia bacterium]|nr:hypothetical protein FACS1894164_11330 [Spirochaetia bacterium]GHU31508.1 hypothetical protein FACS1894172_06530 [Spirochaetia bacterium]